MFRVPTVISCAEPESRRTLGWRTYSRIVVVALSALFCLIVVARYCWLRIGPAAWGPQCVCDKPVFDCGVVSGDRTLEHEFVIHNIGRQSLHILKVVPSCAGCTRVTTYASEIAPTGQSTVKVALDTANLKPGQFNRQVLIETNDPNSSKVVLNMIGTVKGSRDGDERSIVHQ